MMIDTDDSQLVIAVIGARGCGKTTFINIASGSNLPVGSGLESCTSVVQVGQPFDLNGQSVILMDTPGFDDTMKNDTDILRMIADFLSTTYQCGKKLAGIIQIHHISDIYMGGISWRNFMMLRRLCGDDTLQNLVIVTNRWDEVTREFGEAREALLTSEVYAPVLEKGALFLRHEHTTESAHAIIQRIMQNHLELVPLSIQYEIVDEGKHISETGAGDGLIQEHSQQIQFQHRRDLLREFQEEMKEAARIQDEKVRREIEIKLWQIYCAKYMVLPIA